MLEKTPFGKRKPPREELGYLTPDEDIDGESLGSQDTATEDEGEEEEEEDFRALSPVAEEDETLLSPPSLVTPQRPPRVRKQRQAQQPIPPPPKKTRRETKRDTASAPGRGKYRSWSRYRVDIHQALFEAVFDCRKAIELLKNRYRVFVPASVVSYYAKKLCSSSSPYSPRSSATDTD